MTPESSATEIARWVAAGEESAEFVVAAALERRSVALATASLVWAALSGSQAVNKQIKNTGRTFFIDLLQK